jgi:flagellar motor switch protein FliN/FliY
MPSFQDPLPVGKSPAQPKDLQRLLRIDLAVIAVLAEKRMKLGEVVRLDVDSVIEFEKSAREPLELMVNDRRVGRGEAVKTGENFGVRVTSIADPRETIQKLGHPDTRQPA